MNIKRIIRDIGFMTRMTSSSRAQYAKKKNIFNAVGNDVRLPFMRLPLYPKLVTFHNNIEVASGVRFITHDAIHGVLNNAPITTKICGGGYRFKEEKFRIEVFDNVFIGANTIICGNVKIGPNAVIGTGSVVLKDVPEGTVYAGVPARQIGTFDELVKKRSSIKKIT